MKHSKSIFLNSHQSFLCYNGNSSREYLYSNQSMRYILSNSNMFCFKGTRRPFFLQREPQYLWFVPTYYEKYINTTVVWFNTIYKIEL